MKITILGTAPGKSLKDKSHTAYLIEGNDYKCLLDCGEGTTQKLLAKDLVRDEIDFIIISHLHPDHVTGLFILLQTLYLNKRSKDLLVFLPEGVPEFESFMKSIYIFNDRFSYRILLQAYNERTFEESLIFPYKNSHLIGYKSIVDKYELSNKLLSYSFILKGDRKQLLLSSDISSVEDIKQQIIDCEIMILDGIHPSSKAIAEVLKNRDIKVYITHGEYENLQTKYADLLSNNIRLAGENDEIILFRLKKLILISKKQRMGHS